MNRERAKELQPIIEHFANGGGIEYYSSLNGKWLSCPNPSFQDVVKYRIAKVPDKFTDWDVLPFDYKWIARDKNGNAFATSFKPIGPDNNDGEWMYGVSDDYIRVDQLTCYERGTVDWQNSLIERTD